MAAASSKGYPCGIGGAMTEEEFNAADNAKLDGIVVRMDRRTSYKGCSVTSS
jgi:hypothetical protein